MDRVFGIIPSSSGPLIFTVAFSLVLLAVIGLLIFIGYSSRHVTFTVSDQGLRIGPSLYGRFIPREKIMAEGVRVINLKTDQEYQPKWRTNGVGLPGYAEGWFKLKNKEKALLFITDRSCVVYIPTTGNYSVLLSVREAEDFAESVRSLK